MAGECRAGTLHDRNQVEVMLGIRVAGEGIGEIRHIRNLKLRRKAAHGNAIVTGRIRQRGPLHDCDRERVGCAWADNIGEVRVNRHGTEARGRCVELDAADQSRGTDAVQVPVEQAEPLQLKA